MIKARIIADSVSPTGHRITTMEVTFHRFILAELNTHRAFSRNSASSRARSTKITIDETDRNLAMPLRWMEEARGMSGRREVSESLAYSVESIWHQAYVHAMEQARKLADLGIHKSLVNRIIEPYMWHTAVVTATDWDNFFDQRLALLEDGTPAAQPEMYELALRMKNALAVSMPSKLDTGDWHLPYITSHDVNQVAQSTTPFSTTRLCQISVARCAGVSYMTQGVAYRDHDKDVALFERLRTAEPPHWSPFEHVATPLDGLNRHTNRYVDNFCGWQSYRNLLNHLREVE